MKATLGIEAIGHNSYQAILAYKSIVENAAPFLGAALEVTKIPYWVARITGNDKSGYKKVIEDGKRDYSKSNSTGSRGIYIWYVLVSGCVYEVSEPVSWKRTRHYFCEVTDTGDILEISKEEVDKWIANKERQSEVQVSEDWELPY